MVEELFLKMLIIEFLYGVVKNQHFQSTILGGRYSQKSTLCMLLIMLTILDDPL